MHSPRYPPYCDWYVWCDVWLPSGIYRNRNHVVCRGGVAPRPVSRAVGTRMGLIGPRRPHGAVLGPRGLTTVPARSPDTTHSRDVSSLVMHCPSCITGPVCAGQLAADLVL